LLSRKKSTYCLFEFDGEVKEKCIWLLRAPALRDRPSGKMDERREEVEVERLREDLLLCSKLSRPSSILYPTEVFDPVDLYVHMDDVCRPIWKYDPPTCSSAELS
jgi:hypothetical protein